MVLQVESIKVNQNFDVKKGGKREEQVKNEESPIRVLL